MSLPAAANEILSFLTQVFDKTTTTEYGDPTSIVLQHIDGTGQEREIFHVKTSHAKWGQPDQMTEFLVRYAQRHAKGLVGAQQFKMEVTYAGSQTPQLVLPFGLTGVLNFGAITGSSTLSTEPPTHSGQMSQGMRHAEIVFGNIQSTFQVLGRLVQQLMEERKDLQADNREIWAALKNVLSEWQKERFDRRMAELNAARVAEFQKQIMAMAPALINMMMGKDVFPSAVAEDSLLDGLAAGATPEQFNMFTQYVRTSIKGGTHLAGVLQDRYTKYHDRKTREAAEEKRLMNETPGRVDLAEVDATGQAYRALRGDALPPEPVKQALPAKVFEAIDESPRGPVHSNGAFGHGTNGANGTNGSGEVIQADQAPESIDATKMPADDAKNLDTELWEDFFKVAGGNFDMLLQLADAQDPEFAARMRARFNTRKP